MELYELVKRQLNILERCISQNLYCYCDYSNGVENDTLGCSKYMLSMDLLDESFRALLLELNTIVHAL